MLSQAPLVGGVEEVRAPHHVEGGLVADLDPHHAVDSRDDALTGVGAVEVAQHLIVRRPLDQLNSCFAVRQVPKKELAGLGQEEEAMVGVIASPPGGKPNVVLSSFPEGCHPSLSGNSPSGIMRYGDGQPALMAGMDMGIQGDDGVCLGVFRNQGEEKQGGESVGHF